MNTRIAELREYILDKKHRQLRRTPEQLGIADLASKYAAEELPAVKRSSACLATMLEKEKPVILPGEKIVFTRTITAVPAIFTEKEWDGIKSKYYLHEKGYVCNISPDYEYTVNHGLEARKKEIEKRLKDAGLNAGQKDFLEATLQCVEALQAIVGRYEKYADAQGEKETAAVLHNIRTKGAGSLREALQLLRVLHFGLWESGSYHNTLGRFDQYIYPFYKKDIEAGALTGEQAFDLVQEFFLMCNKDSDLYPGMQQGDNGQSMVLGGRNAKGEYQFNEISRMALRASYELEMIDPKINIRVDSKTPAEIFELGSQLTKIGLGFPQYSNDDVIIPGLVRKGYSSEDAHDYVVAACWEFIIPKVAMDIPNIDAVSLVNCVRRCLAKLPQTNDYASFYKLVEAEINKDVEAIVEKHKNLYMIPAPLMSLLMDGTVECAQDISEGSKYNNYGLHGTGISVAADALAAIKKYCFEDGTVDADALTKAVDSDFKDNEDLKKMLREEAPKMGQDNDYVDLIARDLLDSFDAALTGRVNERGGIYRAGTGTAMYYIWHASELGATADGRGAGEMIPANYSPSLFMKQKGRYL